MLRRFRSLCLFSLASALIISNAAAQPVGNGFTYQGELRNAGIVANGTYDLRFRLYDALASGAQVGPSLCVDNVPIADGTFTVELDFGSVFAGSTRYLEIDVREDTGLGCASGTGFVTLAPRQRIATTPYAAYALTAANATTATSAASATTALSAGNSTNLNGQPASFYTNATNLTAGTLPDARLSSNVTTLSGTQTFSGAKSFSTSPSFTAAGSPFSVTSSTKVTNLNADLLDGLDSGAFAAASHAHDAGAIVSGTLADARIPTSIPRLGTLNTYTAANIFNAFAGVNRSSPLTSNEVFGLQNASGATGYAGMYISSTDAAGGRPFYGYSVNSQTAWTYVEPGGQWRVHNGADRLAISRTTGDVGIGTTSPGARLEVSAADAAMRIRNTNDVGGGFVQNTFSTLQLGLYNPTAGAWGVVPAGGTRAMLGVQNTGRVGTLTNTSGSPSWRNTIDDGSGNASFAGSITSAVGFAYATPQVRTLNIQAEDFRAFSTSTPGNFGGGPLFLAQLDASVAYGVMHAALPLPQGAQITSLLCSMQGGAGGPITIELRRRTISNNNESIMASGSSDNMSGEYANLTLFGANTPIDHTTYVYRLYAICNDWTTSSWVRLVRITYTVPAAD
ncbi:MAG: hypothetical protein KF838_13470 [Phycisphaeraceae bacterium]|nr:MAG: hypothetical protein KF838_13470 [Phycisphaeraceae bacterium]